MIWKLPHSNRDSRRSSGFHIAAALTVSLGTAVIGIVTALADTVLFRPLPVRAPQQLVYLYWVIAGTETVLPAVGYPDYQALRQISLLEDVAAHWNIVSMMGPRALRGYGVPLRGEAVSGNYFTLLGVDVQIGRPLGLLDDDPTQADRPIIISDRLWHRHFQRDPYILGRTLELEQGHFTVVGVAARTFRGVADPWTPSEFWISLTSWRSNLREVGVAPLARLKAEVTPGQVEAAANALSAASKQRRHIRYLVRHSQEVRLPFDPKGQVIPLRLAIALAAMGAVVFCISLVNLLSIVLVRLNDRWQELSTRLLLGAGHWSLIGRVTLESALPSMIGGLLGAGLAGWLLTLFGRYTPTRFTLEMGIDARLLVVFSVLVGTVTLGCTFLSALATHRRFRSYEASRFGGAMRAIPRRSRRAVLVPQVGLAAVLVILAVAQLTAAWRFQTTLTREIGSAEEALIATLAMADFTHSDEPAAQRLQKFHERASETWRRIVNAVAVADGGREVALTSSIPLDDRSPVSVAVVTDTSIRQGSGAVVYAQIAEVSPNFFKTIGMPALMGREFGSGDTQKTTSVVVISLALAAHLWPGEQPIGKRLRWRPASATGTWDGTEDYEVVGIVRDPPSLTRDGAQMSSLFRPLAQTGSRSEVHLVIGSPGTVTGDERALRDLIVGIDPFVAVIEIRRLREYLAEILYPQFMATAVVSLAALCGLMLAGAGVYGTMSYSVRARMHEIGVRLAVGATRSEIRGLILGEAGMVAAAGFAAAVPVTYWLVNLLERHVAQVEGPSILAILFGMTLVLISVFAASIGPAGRACRTDPTILLRR